MSAVVAPARIQTCRVTMFFNCGWQFVANPLLIGASVRFDCSLVASVNSFPINCPGLIATTKEISLTHDKNNITDQREHELAETHADMHCEIQ